MKKNCITCNKEYSKPYQMGIGVWRNRKYCCHKCYWKNKHDSPWNKGKTATTDKRILSGDRAYQWRGAEASYIPKHAWVAKYKGKLSFCEHCKTTTAKKFEWANKDHSYKRNLEDYIRLCTSCHRIYDKTWLKRNRDQKGRFS